MAFDLEEIDYLLPDTWTQTCLIPVGYTTGGGFIPSSRRDSNEGIMLNAWDMSKQ